MPKHKYTFEAFGTQWVIETNSVIVTSLKTIIRNRIEAFDATYSRFRKDSLVTDISNKAGTYTFPADAIELFGFYKSLYELTNGKVTPLIGDVISRAGYDAEYSLISKPQMGIATWSEVLSWQGPELTTTQPVLLDVGAAGKGYMVDIIAAILDDNSCMEYVVDASGDIRHKGSAENKVGLEHPLKAGIVIGAVDVQNKSLCASASNRRAWGNGVHHIFDPDTLAPTNDVIATWAIADEAMVADGLATALFFTAPEVLKKEFDFDYVRMFADGSVQYSPSLESSIF